MPERFERIPESAEPVPEEQQKSDSAPPPVKKEIRTFSKEHDPEGRKRIAAQIGEIRTQQQELQQKRLEHWNKRIEVETDSNQRLNLIDQWQQELEQHNNSLVSKILNWHDRKKLKSLIQGESTLQEVRQRELVDLALVVEQIDQQITEKEALQEARHVLEKYYSQQAQELVEYTEDQKIRQVDTIAQEHQVLFLHGMSKYIPEQNSLLMEDGRVNVLMKTRIALSLDPTLPTSTIKEGDNEHNVWHRSGVIVVGGVVKYAHPGDAGTVAQGVKRRTNLSLNLGMSTQQMIDNAINNRGENTYNEFVVAEPQFGDMYIFLDEKGTPPEDAGDIFYTSEQLNIPVCAIRGGKAFETSRVSYEKYLQAVEEYDFHDEPPTFQLGPEVSYASILENGYQRPEEEKQRMLNDVLAELPFDPIKLKIPEAVAIQNWEYGREAATILLANQGPVPVTKKEYHRVAKEFPSIPEGATVEHIDTFDLFAGGSEYLLYEGKVYERRRSKWAGSSQRRNRIHIETIKRDSTSDQWIDFDIRTPEEYLTKAEERIKKMQESLQEGPVREGWTQQDREELYREGFENISWKLYGFADQARKLGQPELAGQATVLAENVGVVTYTESQRVIEKRIKNGKFVLTKEDLG